MASSDDPVKISGKLVNNLKSPLANHKIVIMRDESLHAEVVSNRYGEFDLNTSFPEAAQFVYVVTSPTGATFNSDPLPVLPPSPEETMLQLQIDGGNRVTANMVARDRRYFLNGIVIDEGGSATSGLTVEAWQLNGADLNFLSTAEGDEYGRFQVSFLESDCGELPLQAMPHIFTRVYRGTQLLADTQNSALRSLAPGNLTDLLISINQTKAGANSDLIFSVSGQIALVDGRGVAGYNVGAYDKHLGGETLLGQVVTDANGFYSIRYDANVLRSKGKDLPDLIVRTFQSNPSAPESQSSLMLQAGADVIVNLSISEEEFVGLSTHEATVAKMGNLLDGVSVADLQNQDLAYLSGILNLSERETANYVHSQTLAQQLSVDSKVIYALLKKSFSGEPGELAAMETSELANAIRDAAEENLLPETYKSTADSLALDLRKKVANLAITTPGATPLKDALSLAGLTTGEMSSVMAELIDSEANVDAKDVWTNLVNKSILSSAKAADLQLVIELSAVTANNVPLVQALKNNPAIEASRDLVEFDRETIVTLLNDTEVPIPSFIEGNDISEQRDNYARFITNTVEVTWPTPVMAARLKTDASIESSNFDNFFASNPNFEFRDNRVTVYLSENVNALDSIPAAERADFTEDLKAMERVFKITPQTDRYDAASVLWKENLHSALSVKRMGSSKFMVKYGPQIGLETAESVYNKADQVASMSLSTMGIFGAEYNTATPDVIYTNTFEPGSSIDEIADLESLFGSLDFCACKHCRSVYSAAAYLADLLAFLNEVDVTVSDTVKDKLFERRAEIGEILLNCENTNTPVPYIDLVNEVLENAVSPYASYNLQTTLDAAALKANPEHINPAAYDLLKTQVYPFSLPFSLWQEEARTYLSHLGVAPSRLMEVLPPASTAIADLDVATESLGLIELERKIITGTGPSTLAAYFGVANINDLDKSGTTKVSVIKLMQQASLSFDELLAVLLSKWVNPTGKEVEFAGAACDLDQATINLTNTELGYFHRFTRLWRKSGMSTVELDMCIYAVGETAITNNFIVKFAGIKRLLNRYSIGVAELLTWWGNISTAEYGDFRPQYEDLFLNPSVNNPIDAVEAIFELNTVRTELNVLSNTIDDPAVSQYVLAAVNISTEDLSLLIERELPNNNLNLANLSHLYRVASFSRALGLSIPDYLSLRAITGQQAISEFTAYAGTPPPYKQTPLILSTPAATLQFSDMHATVAASGFSIGELNYLLRHEFPTTSTIAPNETGIESTVAGIHANLNKIKEDLSVSGQNDRETASKILGLFLDEASVNEAIAILDSNSLNTEIDQGTFIDNNFNAFLDATGLITAKANLVTSGGSLVGETARYGYLLPILETYLSASLIPAQMAAFVKEEFAKDLGISSSMMDSLLNTYVHNPNNATVVAMDVYLDSSFISSTNSIVRANFTDQFATYDLLHKIGLFLGKVKAKAIDLEFLFVNKPANWPDLEGFPLSNAATAMPYSNLERVVKTFALNDYVLSEDFSVAWLMNEAANGETEANSLADLAEQTGWSLSDLQYLAGSNGYNYATGDPNYREKEAWLLELADAFAILRPIGVGAEQAKSWNVVNVTQSIAEAIRNSAKAKYENKQWLSIAPPLRDVLREKQRDALSAYLLAQNPQFIDRFALYEYYLIDTEMSSCGVTTRIKLAISSVQLFVQRIILNLEPGISLTRAIVGEWQWRKNYRVWEANRKVFLYPENWIEPELRDDKSIFFDNLESQILQEEITDAAADRVFKDYLEKLDEVDYLEIAGMYREKDDDEGVNIVHVFARTKAKPHDYYYRQWVDDTYWTGWEKVEADIEGEHLVPVVYNKRLILFWLQTLEKTIEPSISDISASGSSVTPKKAKKYFEFHIFWSERKHGGKWTKKKVSTDFVTSPDDAHSPLNTKDFYIRADRQTTGELFVYPVGHLKHVSDSSGNRYYHPRGVLIFASCSDQPQYDDTIYPGIKRPSYIDAEHRYMKFLRKEPKMFTYANGTKHTVLQKKVGSNFLLTYPHQYSGFVTEEPFFYEDKLRSFFVVPRFVEVPIYDMVYVGLFSYVGESVAGSGAGYSSPSDTVAEGRFGGYFSGNSDAGQVGIPGGDTVSYAPWSSGVSGYASVQVGTITQLKYEFSLFHHPYICLFIRQINKHGVDGFLNPDPNRSQDDVDLVAQGVEEIYFDAKYDPTTKVLLPYPEKEIDFKLAGGYSLYNWELFFHAPLMIATRLSQNQKFAEAQKWFHYIFDPTETEGNTPERYWRTKPFHWYNGTTSINQLLYLLNQGNQEAEKQVEIWRKNPFNPHLIARMRLVAYMKNVVMKYLDNLIAWGDYLFAQDSIESINEATQLYILAAQILGRRPQKVQRDDVVPKTYNQLEPLLDAFSNALVQLENTSIGGGSGSGGSSGGSILSYVLYFCIPPNDKLLGYWDLVEDRLFKIRHCMNLAGIVRQLPLFQPPIDPALLVKAAAAGVDIGSALADMNAAKPYYRFRYMIQKTREFNSEVQSLGSALLSALEKRDAEELSILRTQHEVALHKSIRNMKALAIQEAEETIRSLEIGKEVIEKRRQYYATRPYMIGNEILQLKKMERAMIFQAIGQGIGVLASALSLMPNISVGIAGFGGTPTVTASFGGQQLGQALNIAGGIMTLLAGIETHGASRAGIKGGYDRRKQDWDFQASLAAKEKEQADKQIAAARIRKAMAERDLDTVDLQIEQSDEVVTWMEEKYTNGELYGWQIGQISSLFFQSYQMAYDLAKRTEKTYQHELAVYNTNFVQFGYWDSLKKGLLAGEKLGKDLRRMEASYIELNKREYEITKHVSLAMLDPNALLNLRENGTCFFEVPEVLYDLDFPGHYMRRIKSVSLTIPCVTGPYTSVSAKLILTHNRVRKDALPGGSYTYTGLNDSRFDHDIVGSEAIATSSGNADDGLFELRFEDDRYLPFEGAGAISTWTVELPDQFRQFDYDTISDVILHINYTAREGGDTLKNAVVSTLQAGLNTLLDELGQSGNGMLRLFSLRHEFPTEFHQFLHPGAQADQETTLSISRRHFPKMLDGKSLDLVNPVVILKLRDGYAGTIPSNQLFHLKRSGGTEVQQSAFALNPDYGNLPSGTFTLSTDADGEWTLKAKNADILALPAGLKTTEIINTVTYNRIVADEIEDILIMFEYTAS